MNSPYDLRHIPLDESDTPPPAEAPPPMTEGQKRKAYKQWCAKMQAGAIAMIHPNGQQISVQVHADLPYWRNQGYIEETQ